MRFGASLAATRALRPGEGGGAKPLLETRAICVREIVPTVAYRVEQIALLGRSPEDVVRNSSMSAASAGAVICDPAAQIRSLPKM
jgi:hypothetical protein